MLFRSVTFLLLFILLNCSCFQNSYFHTIQTESYALKDLEDAESKKIFIDTSVVENDLSKVLFLKNIKTSLQLKGHRIVNSPKESDLILSFDILISKPIQFLSEETETIGGSKSVQEVTKPNGEKETITTVQPEQEISYLSPSIIYEKLFWIEVRTQRNDLLVWQSQARILNEELTYAPYASSLVYEATRSFLNTSKRLPQRARYGLWSKNRAKRALSK